MEKNASTIDRIYKKLEPQRQAIVYQFAEQQLHEQQTQAEILSFPRRDEMTLAAHAGDPEKIFSKEEIEKIHDYLDEIDAKYQQSISSDKKRINFPSTLFIK